MRKTHGTLTFLEKVDPTYAAYWRMPDTKNGYWQISANPDVMIRIKRLFPRVRQNETGQVTVMATPEVSRDIEWLMMRWPLVASADTLARLTAQADKHRDTEASVNAILNGTRERLPLTEPARPARDYQLVAADLALTTRALLLTDELGLGKSMSALLTLRDPASLPALIVCPTHLPRQWEDELAKTLPWLRAHTVRTMKPYDPAKHRSMRGHDPDVLIVPYSRIRGWNDVLAGKVRTVIFDEAQELRRADSQKYTAAAHVAGGAHLRIGLTATPVYNYGGEIYNVLDVLSPGVLGTREEFGREWCGGGWSVDAKIRVKDPAALGVHLREQGLMLRRTRKEVGRELPAVVRVPHTVDADEDVIDEIADDAERLAKLILARESPREELFRASGEFDWKMRHATGVAKAGYVAEFVRLLLETDEQVVLWGWHRDVYDIWLRKLIDHNPVMYTGSESPTQKNYARDKFVDGTSRLMIMSLRSGSGLDGLQEVCNVGVFGELDWSPGMHDQCIGRLHRDGQEEAVVAYFLVSEHGADPVMADVLNLKRQQSEPLQNPDRELFEHVSDENRVVRLAEEFLKRKERR